MTSAKRGKVLIWEMLTRDEKRATRHDLMCKIRKYGPMTMDEIRSRCTYERRLLVSPALRHLVGNSLLYKDRESRYVIHACKPSGKISKETYYLAVNATDIGPGPHKVPVLAARYEVGIGLWNDNDCKIPDIPDPPSRVPFYEPDDEESEVL